MTGIENHGLKEKFSNALDQSGMVSVIVGAALIMIAGFAALAIDIGQMAWVKGELENAADAGALAGARGLVPYIGSPLAPNWAKAGAMATQTVQQNRAAGQSLTDCQIQTGYWNLKYKNLQSTSIIPTSADVPAIQVQIAKSTGNNGGPIQMMLAPILGVNTANLQAQSTAMTSFPSGMPVGALFPLAAAETIVNQYWTKDPPVSFKIGYGSTNGQWTSLQVNSNSGSYIASLIANGNPTSLALNANIYIQSGVTASNYGNAAPHVGQTVIIPLANPTDITTNSTTPVLGFVAFRIEAVNQSSKYIQGHFDKNISIKNASGAGAPITGTLSTPNPPQLVN